MFNLPS